MSALLVLGCIAAAAAAGLLAAAGYYGAFKKVEVEVATEGGELLVLEELRGDYRRSGLAMDRVYGSLLKDFGIATYKGIGIYHDDPKKTAVADLRSEAGCVLEQAERGRAAELSARYTIKELPRGSYLKAEFPMKGRLSTFFGMLRVHPALEARARREGLDIGGFVAEIYDVPNKTIVYLKQMRPGT